MRDLDLLFCLMVNIHANPNNIYSNGQTNPKIYDGGLGQRKELLKFFIPEFLFMGDNLPAVIPKNNGENSITNSLVDRFI